MDETYSSDHDRDRDSIQVISRTAAVLRILSESPEGLSLTELARHSDLARSTIQRIVRSLEHENFVEPGPLRNRYVLGRGLKALLRQPAVDVAAAAQPFLRELAGLVDETVDLSVLRGGSAVFIGHIAGKHRLSALSAVGTVFPLHSTANGKALLACLPEEKRLQLLSKDLAPDTPHTKTDIHELAIELRQIELSGISYDIEEHTLGVCAIGAGFIDPHGSAYSISIPVPRQRFEAKQRSLTAPLLNCKSAIVDHLAHHRST